MSLDDGSSVRDVVEFPDHDTMDAFMVDYRRHQYFAEMQTILPWQNAKRIAFETAILWGLNPHSVFDAYRGGNGSEQRADCECRWEIMYRLRQEEGWSFPRIARFTKRDHRTVMHGVEQHRRRLKFADMQTKEV